MHSSRFLRLVQVACVCALPLAAACGDDEGDGTTSGDGGSGATSSASGGTTGTTSGSSGTTGTTTSGATGSTGSGGGGTTSSGSGGGSSVDCGSLPICDDFEGGAAGQPPGAPWGVVTPNCSGTGTVAVDDTQAHSGTKSVKVSGAGGYCNHVFFGTEAIAELGAVAYGRFFVRFEDALGEGHTTFLAMKDTGDNGKDLRMGGQNKILMWNRESDDATLPVLSPAGTAMSIQPETQKWLCVEFMVDGNSGLLQTWVDGAEVQGLHVDGTPTPEIDQQWLNNADWKPSVVDLKLGWEGYAGQGMNLWFDDVALAAQRIGCD